MLLDRRLVCNRHHRLYPVFHFHRPGVSRHQWLSLEKHIGSILLGLFLLPRILLDPGDELVSRPRVRDVLDPDVDALLDVSVADSLVDNHADGGLGDVVDHAGFAVVDFVGHAFLHCAVDFDVDDVSDSVYHFVIPSGCFQAIRIVSYR